MCPFGKRACGVPPALSKLPDHLDGRRDEGKDPCGRVPDGVAQRGRSPQGTATSHTQSFSAALFGVKTSP